LHKFAVGDAAVCIGVVAGHKSFKLGISHVDLILQQNSSEVFSAQVTILLTVAVTECLM
jgi:hypothetical protein